MFNFLKGLFGNYKGYQQTKPNYPIVDDTKPATVDNVMQIPGVWQCVSKICNTIASLPCDVLKITDTGHTELDRACHLAYLLNVSPNKDMTPYDFIRAMALNYVLNGNAYARISYARGANYVSAITPLNAEQVQVINNGDGVLSYEYYTEDDKIEHLSARDVLHWKSIGNGLVGLSLKEFARSTLNEAAMAQNASNDTFSTRGKMAGILTSDRVMNDKQRAEVSQQFASMRDNKSIGVLPVDLKFTPLNMSPADIQLLQTREFIVKEFARWFGIPFGLLSGEASNLDELNNYFYKSTILPMCISLEQALMGKIACDESSNHIVKFRLSFLNRASDSQRATLNATYVQNGIKTRNEVRREEGLKDVDGGDILTAQTNLAPLDQLSTANYDPTQTEQQPLTTEPIKQ